MLPTQASVLLVVIVPMPAIFRISVMPVVMATLRPPCARARRRAATGR